jgi:hypothetical protein
LVEAFINNLAEWAAKDRDGLLCHLNSYAQHKESLAPAEAFLRSAAGHPRAQRAHRTGDLRAALLHAKGPVEAQRFLRDFGYDPNLLGRDEVDEKALLGLRGLVRTSRTMVNGRSFLNLEAFAPAGEWEELSPASLGSSINQEARDDL